MSGTNHNMNGVRIETRVLAPPGGFSSLSFGGGIATGDIYRGYDFNPKTNKRRLSKDSCSSETKYPKSTRNSDSLRGMCRTKERARVEARKLNEKENHKRSSHANRERRDSLDELIDNPHKHSSCRSNGSRGSISGQCVKRNSKSHAGSDDVSNHHTNQQKINQNDYAEILRQQLVAKKTVMDDDGFERSHRDRSVDTIRLRAYPQFQHQDQEHRDQQPLRRQGPSICDNPSPVLINRRSQYGSGGGQSTISLSWE